MKNDELRRLEIVNTLKKALLSAASTIHVAANNGVITLFGWVDQFAKKTVAEKATRKIRGVKSVINFIDVVLITPEQKNDLEMEAKIRTIFKWKWNRQSNSIKVNVIMGWVTLSGAMEWNYQKEVALNEVSNLIGIKGITNNIQPISAAKVRSTKNHKNTAIERNSTIDSKEHLESSYALLITEKRGGSNSLEYSHSKVGSK
jgi:osmotically-inducible protein OsmY